jgi:predicted nucleic acid-binding protein
VERHTLYEPLLRDLWACAGERLDLVSSELTLLETLVVPMRLRDVALQQAYEHALLDTDLRLLPLTRDVLCRAAGLRAAIPALRTPDALHAATAIGCGCAGFITNDPGFRRVPGLPVILLDRFLQEG